MKFAFPILTAKGEEFKDAKALTALINGEQSGHYLLGNHNKWHGGIHISDKSAPWCKDKYPVRAMADGKVVAFRMMKDYLTSEFQGESLHYSNCFCLVQHEYCEINAETKAKNEFTFYSLYMHLLPWDQYQSTEKLVLKKGWNARNSVPHANPDAEQQRVDAALPRFTLPKDTELEMDSNTPPQKGSVGGKEYDFIKVTIKSQLSNTQMKEAEKAGVVVSQGSSVWIANSPDAVIVIKPNVPTWLFDQIDAEVLTNMVGRADPVLNGPTGRLRAGDRSVSLPAGTKVTYDAHRLEFHWVGDKARKMAKCEYVTPNADGAAGSCGMAWVCVEDEFIKVNARTPSHLGELYVLPSPVAIAAGETIGYLGLVETPGSLIGGKKSKHQVHLEIFTQDPRLDDVLANKAGTKGGATYAKVPAGLILHEKKKQDGKNLWVATGDKSLEALVESPTFEKDAAKQEWVSISSGKYVKKEQVELLSQHDWLKIGFKKVDGSGSDGYLDPDAPPTFFTELVNSFDTDKSGELSSEEIQTALQNSSNAEQLHKLIVKHPSEWYEKSSASSYLWLEKLMAKIGLPDFDLLVDHEKQRIDKLEWMQSAAKLKFNGEVSHLYPLSIIIKPMVSEHTITTELIELLLGHKNDWFTGERGGKAFASKFKKDYPNVYKYNKTDFVVLLNEMLFKYEINGPYHKAHFLSQCLHESAHLDTTLEFGSGVNYDPGRHADAEKNGNTKIGDGPTYRGRGLIQLTWKNNYIRFSKHSGVDCVNDSSLVAASMANAIEASCWYWRFNGAVHKKFDAKGDINILVDNDRDNVKLITLAVNGGDNGLLDRMKYFNLIKTEWGLD
ncbi:glycoside hydrolase family 19 protein [Aeromonas caviae]|uniref:glycoside hydrolase family 19 protein n=1 Tax=Aeromonas caviae TaxID=648 RepID=UPI002B495206|nr:glycoside hydrolase family 19 protein [Aeromonas caviae]